VEAYITRTIKFWPFTTCHERKSKDANLNIGLSIEFVMGGNMDQISPNPKSRLFFKKDQQGKVLRGSCLSVYLYECY
jgi:hypothetical protein